MTIRPNDRVNIDNLNYTCEYINQLEKQGRVRGADNYAVIVAKAKMTVFRMRLSMLHCLQFNIRQTDQFERREADRCGLKSILHSFRILLLALSTCVQ